MNYIAHIHLAHQSGTSMVGNFLGDFVKGSQLEHLPEDIQQGIRLHRSIDSFTDQHPIIISQRKLFPSSIRRVSGIVLDVYFDYLLCTHWQTFNENTLADVLTNFYSHLSDFDIPLSNRFEQVKQGLLSHQWLSDYHHRTSCIRAFYQIEKRLGNRVQFAALADAYIQDNHATLERTFLAFYPASIQHVSQQIQ